MACRSSVVGDGITRYELRPVLSSWIGLERVGFVIGEDKRMIGNGRIIACEGDACDRGEAGKGDGRINVRGDITDVKWN